MEGRFGPIEARTEVVKNVASNDVGLGAVLYQDASGDLVGAVSNAAPGRPGLFLALEEGTGARRVLCWTGVFFRNSAWSLIPGQPIYLGSTPGVFATSGPTGSAIGYADTENTIYFGPVHQSFESAVITITHTGQTFEAILDVDVGATIEWRFSDDTIDNTDNPVKDFGTAGTRQTELRVTPWSALLGLVVGYDGGDGGELGAEYELAQQNVTLVEGLGNASGLQFFAASNNPVTSLDFANCAALETVECLSCTSLQSVGLSGAASLIRLCIEACAVQSLDLSDCVALEDIRAGTNGIDGITWGTIGANIRHLCMWGNTNVSLPDVSRFVALEELLMWDSNLSGALTFDGGRLASLDMHGNQITSVDVSCGYLDGASGVLNVSGNQLAALDVSNSSEILNLDASNNLLDEAAVDGVLATMDAYGTSNGTIDLSGNAIPSAAGLASVASLESRGWTVTVGSGIAWQDLFDRADTTELDNGWAGHNADGQITSNALVSDAGGYGILYNACGGALPANHYVEWTIPHARVTTDNWWGIATHIDTTTFDGCGLFFMTDLQSPIICNTAEAGGAPTSTITITGGFPASWSVDQDHTIGLEAVGTAWRIIMDGQEYGTFTRSQSGTAIGVIGEGGKNWLDVTVTEVVT
jgi:hypothetical protein